MGSQRKVIEIRASPELDPVYSLIRGLLISSLNKPLSFSRPSMSVKQAVLQTLIFNFSSNPPANVNRKRLVVFKLCGYEQQTLEQQEIEYSDGNAL